MEAAVVNVIEPGDAMVVCVNGVFGGRMVDVAQRAGAQVTTIEKPWGEVFSPDDLRAALGKAKPKVVGIVMDSGSPDDVLDFVNEYKIPYRQLLGDQEIAAAFGVNQGYPTTFVIDGEGMIRTKMLGSPPTKFEKLQETVDAALEG